MDVIPAPVDSAVHAIDHPAVTAVAVSVVALAAAVTAFRLLRGIEPLDLRLGERLDATFD